MNRAIFLDKDGTLVEDVPYNVDPARLKLMPGALEGLTQWQRAGYKLVVISNQSGVARGIFPEDALAGVKSRLERLLAEGGAALAGFYYCPHLPEGTVPAYAVDCECRKPAPGLLFQAARDLDINLAASWFVGDILNDVEAGNRAGCRTVLLDNGHETEWVQGAFRRPYFVAADLNEAAFLITSEADRANGRPDMLKLVERES